MLPLSARIKPLIAHHGAIHDAMGMTPHTLQRILRLVANRARMSRPVPPHVRRHTCAVAAVQKGIALLAL
jgi:integrase/recombinase XerD